MLINNIIYIYKTYCMHCICFYFKFTKKKNCSLVCDILSYYNTIKIIISMEY